MQKGTNYGSISTKEKKTLIEACKEGKYTEVQKLLQTSIDIGEEDEHGMSALAHAKYNGKLHCASIIRKEAYHRLTNKEHPYRKQVCESIKSAIDSTKPFDENLFRQIVENEPSKASTYLDTFIQEQDSYFYTFKDMDKIFGINSVKTSALASILKESIIHSQRDEKLECLNHPVMKRLLDIKWELFAAKKYYQQLLWYILMLMAMTNVTLSERMHTKVVKFYESANKTDESWIHDFKQNVWTPISFMVWVFTILFWVSGHFHLTRLDSHRFVSLTQAMYDIDMTKTKCNKSWLGQKCCHFWKILVAIYYSNSKSFDKEIVIPQSQIYKAHARFWLFVFTLLWPIILTIVAFIYIEFWLPSSNFGPILAIVYYNKVCTTLALVACGGYFLFQEGQEVMGENPPKVHIGPLSEDNFFMKLITFFYVFCTPCIPAHRKYYSSLTNWVQLATYFLITIPFTVATLCEFHFDPERNGFFLLGAICTISLWMILLEFLEVNKTAGYLLPIIQEVLRDVWDCLVFYAVFQVGLSCAFYFIFQQKSDSYDTLWTSFSSTYFVLFGENGVDDFQKTDSKNYEMNFGLILRMFHCVVMAVLLMNLLVAIMNKTVDRNWEKLQSRALTSYARAILRIEKIIHFERKAMIKIHKNEEDNHPIFSEFVPKLDLDQPAFENTNPPDDHVVALKAVSDIVKNRLDLVREVRQLCESVRQNWAQVLNAMNDESDSD